VRSGFLSVQQIEEIMKAVVYDRYGPPEVLRLEELATPSPAANEVLVEVVATSVNRSDWECLVGTPAYARIGGLRTPAKRTLGSDIAGRIAAVGEAVTRFGVGDEVYGESPMGGFAEYAVAKESALAHKPESLTFVDASTIPQAGAIALQGTTGVGAGQRLLVNGAGGGTGSFAIQLARRAGAQVVGVDNASKLAFMRAVGADQVVDYESEDFTRLGPYGFVLDLVAHRSVFAYRRSLAPGGRYRCVGGSVPTLLRIITVGALLGRLSGRSIGMLMVKPGPTRFGPLTQMCVSGDIDIHIDAVFPLSETARALARVGDGQALGKVVVEIV
jgi:NADPH:quinone reductase-like Zn-dependent oxidoreductase